MRQLDEKLTALIEWLRKRGEPDSGIDYAAASIHHDRELGFTHRQANVRLWGGDADFIANNFHGKSARDLADALTSALQQAGGVAAGPLSELQGGDKQQAKGSDLRLSVGVRVKPLVWDGDRPYRAIADTILGTFWAEQVLDGDTFSAFELTSPHLKRWRVDGLKSIDEAKVAVQAEFDRRILAALADGGQS
jgi:hypothetical protein